jgi:hypothetical protein
MIKFLISFIIAFAVYEYLFYIPSYTESSSKLSNPTVTVHSTEKKQTPLATHKLEIVKNDILKNAYIHKQSHIQVKDSGTVIKVLKDDNTGSRHQRFLISLPSGQTLLVAHNIDLAPKIYDLKKGDTIFFSGEYIWNKKGGVIHWTHHDPQRKHVGGWLKHKGRTYQ